MWKTYIWMQSEQVMGGGRTSPGLAARKISSRVSPTGSFWADSIRSNTPVTRTGSNLLFQVLYFYWRSPESGDVWYTSRQKKKTICSHSEGS